MDGFGLAFPRQCIAELRVFVMSLAFGSIREELRRNQLQHMPQKANRVQKEKDLLLPLYLWPDHPCANLFDIPNTVKEVQIGYDWRILICTEHYTGSHHRGRMDLREAPFVQIARTTVSKETAHTTPQQASAMLVISSGVHALD